MNIGTTVWEAYRTAFEAIRVILSNQRPFKKNPTAGILTGSIELNQNRNQNNIPGIY